MIFVFGLSVTGAGLLRDINKMSCLYTILRFCMPFMILFPAFVVGTGKQEWLNLAYLIAHAALVFICLPGPEFIAAVLNHYNSPIFGQCGPGSMLAFFKSKKVAGEMIEMQLSLGTALTGVVLYILFSVFDFLYLTRGNLPGLELDSEQLRTLRPVALMFMKRLSATMYNCRAYMRCPRFSYGTGFVHLYLDHAMLTAVGVSLCDSVYQCTIFIVVDTIGMIGRLWAYSGWGKKIHAMQVIRRCLTLGKTKPIDGMNLIELRGWDIYLEGKMSSVGFLTFLMIFPFTLLENDGLKMMNKYLYAKGYESVGYIVAIFLVDIVQDHVTSYVVKKRTGITCFSKYLGNAFTEQTLCCAIPAAGGTMWVGGNMVQLGFVAQKLKVGTFSQ